ncbi:hypothetical protein M3172_11210 [Mesobacillus subterraneus]|uniref:hypothetical protein n=1 Tax=Mesobacillus subterraneus TaxID=285983 RepID=UPI00203F2362|nr:hypothetical protein [Mesobacillus subterraneus]MCM3573754.1 hypothetical protein [Mesobacillus subterraneus]
MKDEKVTKSPLVLSHQQIKFETAQSWNPGEGNRDHKGTGNDGSNWPSNNPNPTPGGAGEPGKGNGRGKGK